MFLLRFSPVSHFSFSSARCSQIWASFPRAGIVRAPKFDLQAAIEALSTKRFATFPPEDPLLTPEGVTGGVKPVIPAPPLRLTDVAPTGSPAETDTGYDSDPDAASRRADVATTMAAVDEMLALDDIASSTRAQQAQHSLASAHSMRARHAAVLLSRSPLFPPMVIRSGDKMPRRVRNLAALHA